MSKQFGFVKWEIHKNNEGNYTDIVYWKSKEDAKKSEKYMVNIPKLENGLDVTKKELLFLKILKNYVSSGLNNV